MKHINLPQEARTNKVETLPDDLKSIAEEMLAKKFGVEEEVVREEPPFDPFLRTHESYTATDGRMVSTSNATETYHRFSERQRGYLDEIHVEVRPWDLSRHAKIAISYPDFRSLIQVIDRLRMEAMERGDMTFYFTPGFYNELRRQPEYFHYSEGYRNPKEGWHEGIKMYIDKILGVKVIINPKLDISHISARF